MALTKVFTLSEHLKMPQWNYKRSLEDSNIIICNINGSQQKYYMFSENYGLYNASYKWVENNAWRIPVEFILRYSVDEHRGFYGIKNEQLIYELNFLQSNLKENFNELVFAIIQNKRKFIEDVVIEFGYKFIWQPIDGVEIIANCFRGYRIE